MKRKTIILHSCVKHTLCINALDRLTAEKCLQHDAFHSLNQKRLHRSHRPFEIQFLF